MTKTKDQPLVIFRADAALHIGTGHIVRCLALAKDLRERSVLVHFVCRDFSENLFTQIEKEQFPLHRLAPLDVAPLDLPASFENENWLGTSWERDAQDTLDVLHSLGTKPDWLIVDHYSLDQRWERSMRSSVQKIMVIDDLFTRAHDCDVLLNQSVLPHMVEYEGLVPKSCKLLVGPQYALLHPQYAKRRAEGLRKISELKTVLVFLGGIDRDNLTLTVVKSLEALPKPIEHVDVVIGASNPHRQKLEQYLANHKSIKLHVQVKDLSDLMFQADLAIGAGGTTTWERCSLGLPSIVIATASNQVRCNKQLAENGYIFYLGEAKDLAARDISIATEVLGNLEYRTFLSQKSRSLVDGQGCERAYSALFLH